jgi:hypothetical protein
MNDWLFGREFYDLMQVYRTAPVDSQVKVQEAFEAVKAYIREQVNGVLQPADCGVPGHLMANCLGDDFGHPICHLCLENKATMDRYVNLVMSLVSGVYQRGEVVRRFKEATMDMNSERLAEAHEAAGRLGL